MMQFVIVSLYTKFEVSVLNSCGDIIDEKSGEKEKRINLGKNKYEKAHFHPTIQLVIVSLYSKFEVSILNGYGDIVDEKSGEEEKKHREEQIGESPFSIPRYNLSL